MRFCPSHFGILAVPLAGGELSGPIAGAKRMLKSGELIMLRVGFALPGIILTGAIFWAFGKADFWTSGAAIIANPWGLVTLIDLYAGFIITGLIIAALERWKLWAFGLLALSLFLGNVVYAVWGVWRGARMLESKALI
jgi:hypothetical protein